MRVEGVNWIWRDARLRDAGTKRAKTLVSAAEHSVGSKEQPEVARFELTKGIPGKKLFIKLRGVKGSIPKKERGLRRGCAANRSCRVGMSSLASWTDLSPSGESDFLFKMISGCLSKKS